ncbi:MAG: hypothetical protein IK002_05925 [Treponema sp.]|uniref:hypothetical protein n=1 Tax=Treponema sp. TaxID=166 RepID=UPI00298DD691|nr:hypothetical protein [Treponema sp.]MBR5933510.1 hypothetical protein [Treponema sp.]
MKKLLVSFLFLEIIFLCIGCSHNNADKTPFIDDFDKASWEADVTESAIYADFTTGIWWYREEHISSVYQYNETGEISVTSDIIGSDYDHPEYEDYLNFTKIIRFYTDGDYEEYSQEQINRRNSSTTSKLYLINRFAYGTIDETKEEWQKSTVITTNSEKTKIKSYTEEWAKSDGVTWARVPTIYYFEKK